MDTCAKNATCISQESCDSLIHSLDNFFKQNARNERIKKCDDIVIYAVKSTSATRKKMLGIFVAILGKIDKKFKMNSYVTLNRSFFYEILNCYAHHWKDANRKRRSFSKTTFCYLDGTNLMSGKYECLKNI